MRWVSLDKRRVRVRSTPGPPAWLVATTFDLCYRLGGALELAMTGDPQPNGAPAPDDRAAPEKGRRTAKRRLRLRQLALAPVNYLWNFHLRGDLSAFEFARRVWGLGASMRIVFGALVALGLLARVVEVLGGGARSDKVIELSFIALCALAFGAAAGAAASWGLVGFALLSPWLASFALPALSALAGTSARPLMALPIWALFLVACRLSAAEAHRVRARALSGVLALGAGWLTSGVSGFRAALGLSWPVGGALLGALLALGGIALAERLRARSARPPSFGAVLITAGGVFGALLAFSAFVDRAGTVSWAANNFPQLDFLVTLFWFWSGAGFAQASWRLVDWTTRRVVRIGLGRALLVAAPTAWVLVGGLEAGLALGYTLGLDLPLELELAGRVHAVVSLGVLVTALLAVLTARARPRRLIDLHAFWLLSLLAVVAVTTKLTSFGALEASSASKSAALVAAVIGVLGIVSRLEKDWSRASDQRVALYAAWGCTFVALLAAGRLAPSWRIDAQMAVHVYEGMLTLGLPVAIYGRLSRRTPAERRANTIPQLALLVAGMVSGFWVLKLDHVDPRALLLTAPVHAVLLAATRALFPAWNRLAGAMAGTLLAAGANLYWRLPTAFCLPFFPAIPSIETLTNWFTARRGLPLETELIVTFAGLPIGALLGWMIFSGRNS